MSADQGKKVSKKVQGLFDGTFISKVLSSASKKKQTNRKLKEFHVKQSAAASLSSKASPHKIDIARDFEQIPFVPVIELTHDQVDNLLKTASELHKQFAKFGAVKLRLPKELEPASLGIENTKKKLTIRQQVLPLLPKGRVLSADQTFVNIKDAYEYKEFFDYSQEVERDFVFETAPLNDPSHPLLRDEREYWGIVYGKIGSTALTQKRSCVKTRMATRSSMRQTWHWTSSSTSTSKTGPNQASDCRSASCSVPKTLSSKSPKRKPKRYLD